MNVQTWLLHTHLQSAKRRSGHTPTTAAQQLQFNQSCVTNAAALIWTRKAFRCEIHGRGGLHCSSPGRSNKDYYVPLLAPSHCSALYLQAWTGRVWGWPGTGREAQAATVNEVWWQCMVMKIWARKPMHHAAAVSAVHSRDWWPHTPL